jgi:hypothetical protein
MLSLGQAIKSASSAGKRRFRGFSVSDPFSDADPDGEDGPGLELSINAFSLPSKKQALGMDEGRKKAMRRLLWYWQWSRDWDWRLVSETVSIQQDQSSQAECVECTDHLETEPSASHWYWHWRRRVAARRRLKIPNQARLHARLLRDKLQQEFGPSH